MPFYRKALPADRFVKEVIRCITRYKVFPAIRRQGLQAQAFAFHPLQCLCSIIDKNVLAVNVVARKQLS